MKYFFSIKVKVEENSNQLPEKKDRCLICNRDTGYKISTPITERLYYVLGCGQLCEYCYNRIYKYGD